MTLAALSIAALLMVAQDATPKPEAIPNVREELFEQSRPFAVITMEGASGSRAEAWGLYAFLVDAPSGERQPYYAVRRFTRLRGAEDAVTWATTDKCSNLKGQMAALAKLPPPGISVPGVEGGPVLPTVLHGISYTFWQPYPRWQGSAGFRLTFSGNVDTPLAAWVEGTAEKLSSCWSFQEPKPFSQTGQAEAGDQAR